VGRNIRIEHRVGFGDNEFLRRRAVRLIESSPDDGKLVGIVSRANLLHALSSLAGNAGEAPEPDDFRIREGRVVRQRNSGTTLSAFQYFSGTNRLLLNVARSS
jgi:hypothetical protein